MLKKFGKTPDGRPLVVLGLSGENLTRLMADEPIMVSLPDPVLGPADMSSCVVVVVGGRTEADIAGQIASAPIARYLRKHPATPDRATVAVEITEPARPVHSPTGEDRPLMTPDELQPGTQVMVLVGAYAGLATDQPAVVALATVEGRAGQPDTAVSTDPDDMWWLTVHIAPRVNLPQMYHRQEILGVPALGLGMTVPAGQPGE